MPPSKNLRDKRFENAPGVTVHGRARAGSSGREEKCRAVTQLSLPILLYLLPLKLLKQ